MIYMVEHTIGMPDIEPEWNAWYAGYLKVLLAVPGIQATQRFRIAGSKPSRYMAVYTLTSGDVFESAIYKASGGGGNASARFRPAYQSWTRNLFDAPNGVPGVAMDQVLVTADRAAPGGKPFDWLTTVGLQKTTPFRGVAVMSVDEAARLSATLAGDITIYTPMTPRMSGAQH